MIEQLTLLWYFLQAQPPEQALRLASWHLVGVLGVLSVLSAFGLHFLVGYVFGFYRRKGKHARWIAWPTLWVLLASLPVLLGAYLLTVRAPALVSENLTSGVTASLGRMLLEPAFQSAPLQAVHPDEVPKGAIKDALHGSAELAYRNRLETFLVDPSAMAAVAGPERRVTGPEVLVQIGLRWVTAPHNTWFAPLRRGDQQAVETSEEQPFFLPDFLLSLIDELPEGTALPRLDWEHVAGTRFVEGVLRPLMLEYLSYLALALAVGVVLVNVLFFLLMARLKRIGQPKPPKPAKAPKAAPAPPPATSSTASAASSAKPAAPAPPAPPPPPKAPPAGVPQGAEAAPKPDAPMEGGDSATKPAEAEPTKTEGPSGEGLESTEAARDKPIT